MTIAKINTIYGRESNKQILRIKCSSMCPKLDRGRGSAVWHGFTTFFDEGFDYFVEMDADFSHSPNVHLGCG